MNINNLELPRYNEIPDVGLYLKQVVTYINKVIEPPFGLSVKETTLSNYVKKHLISNPVKKMYNRDQIATLLLITLSKTVLSLENVGILIDKLERDFEKEVIYNLFCEKFEKALLDVFKEKDEPLHSAVIAMANKLYLDKVLSE